MAALTDRVAQAIRQNAPAHRCAPCLSLQLHVTEREVREAAQILVAGGEFKVLRRICPMCARVDEMVVSGKAAVDVE